MANHASGFVGMAGPVLDAPWQAVAAVCGFFGDESSFDDRLSDGPSFCTGCPIPPLFPTPFPLYIDNEV